MVRHEKSGRAAKSLGRGGGEIKSTPVVYWNLSGEQRGGTRRHTQYPLRTEGEKKLGIRKVGQRLEDGIGKKEINIVVAKERFEGVRERFVRRDEKQGLFPYPGPSSRRMGKTEMVNHSGGGGYLDCYCQVRGREKNLLLGAIPWRKVPESGRCSGRRARRLFRARSNDDQEEEEQHICLGLGEMGLPVGSEM